MNIYLLELIGKWIGFAVIAFTSLFGNTMYTKDASLVDNNLTNKEGAFVSKVIPYETEEVYNSKIPTGKTKVLTKGIDGLSYVKEDGTEEVLEPMVKEVVEVGTGASGTYVGSITNYGPDCYGCSKVGNVACHTREGKNLSLYDTIYYDDYEYGQVRILAATRDVFPCGTIVLVSRGDVKFYGVVLDTGGAMNRAWRESGYILMDLAHASQHDAATSGLINGKGVSYQVERWGW